jgi:hypothetical protein
VRRSRTILTTVAVLLACTGAFGAQVWVVGVLDQGTGKYSRCKAVSEDGQWVVGLSYKSGVAWPFYWSKTLGLADMGNPPASTADVTGCAVTEGGSMIACGNIGGLARQWGGGSWSVLPANPAQTSGNPRSVYAISLDRSSGQYWIGGSSYPAENEKAYRYNGLTGGYIDYWGYYQDVYGIAHNGWAVGKNNYGNGYNGSEPWNYRYEHAIFIFNWTENCAGGGNCGWDQLPRFSGYGDTEYFKSRATAIAPSARWAAGYMTYNPADLSQFHAFKWQVPTNPQLAPLPWLSWARPVDLGTLSGDTLSYAYCVSDSATNPVIGGTSYVSTLGSRAVYWDNAGIHDLYATLVGLGVNMGRWSTLYKVLGISADGTIMVGNGAFDDDDNIATPDVEMGFYVDLVSTDPQPPIVTMQPVSQIGCQGGTVTFTAAGTGAGYLTYQWQKDQVNLANGGHYAGVNTSILTVSTADDSDLGNYRCVIANTDGTAYSNEAVLSLASSPPATPADGAPTADATNKITWRWTDVAGESGYRVKDGAGAIKSGDRSADVAYWQENALASNTSYTRYVCSFNACGESAMSAGQTKYTLVTAPTYGTDTAVPTISCDQGSSASGLALSQNLTFTATNGFGDGAEKVGQFGYLWDTAAGNPTSWSGEQFWTSGTLVKQLGATAGTSRYLHVRAYSNANPKVVNSTVLNLGPYTVGGVGRTCLANPGFESGFTAGVGNSWTKFNYSGSVACADDTTQYHTGAHSQKITSASSSNEGGIYQQFDVTPGQTYTIAVWYKCSSTQVAPYLGIDPSGGTTPTIGVSWNSLTPKTSWTQGTYPNVTAVGSVLTVYFDMVSTSGSGSMWLDDATPACDVTPAKPTDRTPLALSTTGIRWQWNDVSGETGYRVKTTAGAVVSPDLAANATQWDETTGIVPNTQYTRQVYAFNALGESAGSNGQSAYSLMETPTGVSFGTITTTSVAASPSGTLSNLAAGSSGVQTMNVTAGTNSGWQTTQGAWNSTALLPNTPYTFAARGRNGDGIETADSASTIAWTLSSAPTSSSVTPSASSSCINQPITWTAAAGFGAGTAQYYRYAWDQNPIYTWTDLESQWSSGTMTTTPIAIGTWYLHVKGYNGADVGNGTYDYAVTAGQVVAADFNKDCAVDESDFDLFSACVTGPSISYVGALPAGCVMTPNTSGFIAADLDSDGDVDQADFGRFQRCLSGEGTPADPGCAD